MTDTLNLIAQRYACRSFLDTAVPAADLRQIVQAGLQAPSAMNQQPWRIIAITDKTVLEALDSAGLARLKQFDAAGYQRIIDRGGRLLYGAPAALLIAVEERPGPLSPLVDAGIVASHLLIAATALGYQSCPVALLQAALAGPDGEPLRQQLEFPTGFNFALAILVGHGAIAGQQHPVDWSKLIEIKA
jgi:nitroreductase